MIEDPSVDGAAFLTGNISCRRAGIEYWREDDCWQVVCEYGPDGQARGADSQAGANGG
jgi:hypothetical protein